MLKHLQRMLLLVALMLPFATQAQTLAEDYAFDSGVDASRWATLTSPTNLFPDYADDAASSVTNIGFSFTFCGETYTQFSTSSNGCFRLGSVATSSSTTGGQFTSSTYSTNLPKISGIARDMGTGTNGGVFYEVQGTAPNRVLVCEFRLSYTYGTSHTPDVKWQVKLFETSNKVEIVYGPTPSTMPSSWQIGLASTASDIVIINPSTHAATYTTTSWATTYSSPWPGTNRYYEFSPVTVTCPRPFNLVASNIASDEITFTWQDTSATMWMVYYYPSVNASLMDSMMVTDTTFTLTSLTPNTPYTFSVAALCTADDRSMLRTIQTRTACVALTDNDLPYTETFDTYQSGATESISPCWVKGTNSTTAYPYPNLTNAINGSRSLYFYSYRPSLATSTPMYSYAALPVLDSTVDITALTLTFKVKTYSTASTYYNTQLHVGVMTNPNDITTFESVAFIDHSGAPSLTTFIEEVDFSNYTGTGRYIAIYDSIPVLVGSANYGYGYCYVDDVVLMPTPACSRPTNLVAQNATSSTIDLSWSATTAASSYVVTYGLQGAASTMSQVVYDTMVTLTGLAGASSYLWSVYAVCTSTDSSTASIGTFATSCAIDANRLPFTEDFESYGSGSSVALNHCWTKGTSSGTAYPYPYSTNVVNGSRSLYMYSYRPSSTSTTPIYCYAALPEIDSTLPISNLTLNFNVRTYSTASATYNTQLHVGVMTNPNDISTFQTVEFVDLSGAPALSVHNITVDFAGYTGNGHYIAIYDSIPVLVGTSTFGYGYCYVDDINLMLTPSCPRPTDLLADNITENTAELTWTGAANDMGYIVTYGLQNGSVDTITVTSPYVSLYDLQHSSVYQWSVRAICAAGDTTLERSSEFTTTCGAITAENLPVSYGFEDATAADATGLINPCWHKQVVNYSTNYPYPSSTSHSGTRSLYFYAYNGSSYECYLCTPRIDVSWDSILVTFWNRSSSSSYSGNVRVGTMSDPTNRSTFRQLATCTPNGTTWTYQEVPMAGCTDTGRYICFMFTANGDSYSYNYGYIDDITITTLPDCFHVQNLDVAGVSAGGALISWNRTASDPLAEYAVQVKADTSSTWDYSFTDVANNFISVSGLQPGTSYTARVAAFCNYSDSSAWEYVSFQTTGFGCAEMDTTTLVNAIMGTGSSQISGIPVYSSWGNTVSQSIYLNSELVAAGFPSTGSPITDITFNWTTVSTYPKVLTVYMSNTTQSTYSSASASAWVPTGATARVLEADIPLGTSGAVTYHLDTPFSWDGSNLAITITVNQPAGASHSSSSFYGLSTDCSATRSMYKYQDSSPFDGSNLPSITPSSTSTYRPSITLVSAECLRQATCAAPTVVTTHVTSDSVVLAWAPGYDETNWDLSYSTDGISWNYVDNVSEMTYVFEELAPATTYFFRVSTICSSDTFSSVLEVRTQCAAIDYIFEDFNSYPASSAGSISPCWYKSYYNGSTTTYPYPYSLDGNTCMYFYAYHSGSTMYYSWMAAPIMLDSLSSYEVEFDIRKYSTTAYYISQIVVGAMSDPSDFSTFDSITTVVANIYGVWENAYVSLENYHDTSKHYIAFLAPAPPITSAATYSYGYVYLDNVYIGRRSNCPRPTRVHAREVTNNSADIAWDGSEDHISALVKWGTVNSVAAATDSVVVSGGNVVSLTSLNPSTTYYVWVTAQCAEEDSRTYDCSFTTADPCAPVTNLRTVEVSNTAATLAWESSDITPALGYNIQWKADTAASWNLANTTENYFFLTGLAEGAVYTFKVAAICSDVNSVDAEIEFTTSARGTLGTDEEIAPFPTYPFYNHSISEQLWTAEELAEYGDTITSIYFNSASSISDRNMEIFIGNTTLTNLSTTSYVSSADMVRVFADSSRTITAGWNQFQFSTPFVRNHNQSLVVLAHDVNDYESFDGWYASASTINTLYGYDDEDDFSTTNLSGLELESYRAQMRLGASLNEVSCHAPHPVITNTTGSSFDVVWMRGGTETAWSVEYRKVSDVAWTVLAASTTDTFATISSLDASTAYAIRIAALCGTDTAYAFIQGYTACGTFDIPYLEDFNALSSNDYVINSCWVKGNSNTISGTMPYTVNVTGQGMCMLMPSSSYVIFPELNAPINSLQLRCDYVVADTNIYSLVGVCSYPGDFYTMTVIDTLWAHSNGVPEQNIVKFDNYDGTDGYICIYSSYNQSYYDNIRIEYIPACAMPDSVTLDNVTDATAELSWLADGSASSFIVQYGMAGDTAVNTLNVTLPSVTLTGLSHSTSYWMTVSSVCAAMNDTSLTTNHFNFITNCLPVTLPYHESFDSCNVPALDYTGVMPNCWTAHYMTTGTYATGTYASQIYRGATYASSGQYMLRLCGAAVTTLPEMPVDVNQLQIRFHDYNTSISSYGLVIGVCDSNTTGCEASFVPVDTIQFSQASDWYYSYRLASYTGTGRYIAFKNFYTTSTTTYYSYNYIDDITIDYLPNCLPVADVHAASNTTSSVDLTWTDLAVASEWEVSYGTAPMTDPSLGRTSITTVKPYTVSGLSDSIYYFYVRTICGSGDTSIWSPVFSCRPGTWNMRANQTDTLVMCSGHIYDDGGVDGQYSNSQESVIILMPPDSNHIIRIQGVLQGESCCDYFGVYDGIGISAPQLMYNYGSNLAIGPFESTTGPLTIRFHTDGSVQYPGFDVQVQCVYDGCRVNNIRLDTVAPSGTSLNVTWDGSAALYEVEYGPVGFAQGTGTTLTSTTNHITINGLSSLNSYDVSVRGICDGSDTGSFQRVTLQTEMCDNPSIVVNYPATGSTTSTYIPGNSFYNYSYSQVIIDSADLADAGLTSDITAFAFNPTVTTCGDYFTHCDVYLAHTTQTALTGFVPLTTANSTKVIDDRDLCYTTTGWQIHSFDVPFTWDGHSNVIIAFNRRHGSYSSGATFEAHNGRTGQGCYIYQDGSQYDPATVTGGTVSSTVANYRLIACTDAPACLAPVVTGVTHDYESATITWAGTGAAYEVNIKETAAADWPATDIAVAGNSYTFNGLNAATHYSIRLRQDCSIDSIGYSDWVYEYILTDSLPCMTPSNLAASDMTNAEATFAWTANGTESLWDLHVWFAGGLDTIYRVSTNPATVSGFTAGITYNAAVRAICGSAEEEGDWSDTIQFTTAVCPDVTGLATSNVTHNSVTLNWNTNAMAQSWIVEYGYHGFNQGAGTTVTVNTNTYVVNDLLDEMAYDFYVKAVCGTDWNSENWASVTATT
ncbi:MAG: fibronectin type III domain-containing protein, partial [Bacteroidales bacterium]|nr:fibronectin type III domain-containing protein [Candidatus Colimorpha merdihippi]